MGPTIKDFLKWDGMNMDQERVEILKTVVRERLVNLCDGNIVADDIQTFIKQEPHKLKKLEEGRLRLISAVSFVDTMVDRILFGWLTRVAYSVPGRTPCMVGWSPVGGGWKLIGNKFAGKTTLCLDKEAWDWTVPGYLVDMWREVIQELAIGAAPWWRDAVNARFKLLFEDAVFQFADGTRVFQAVKGIQKSGCLLTILLNSLGQSLLHYLANIRIGKEPTDNQPLVIGDDTLQLYFDEAPQYIQALKDLGVRIKGGNPQSFVEFAGFAYANGACWPAYYQKHLFNMAHSDSLPEVLASLRVLYIHEPVMSSFIERVTLEIAPNSLVPRMQALRVMDFPK